MSHVRENLSVLAAAEKRILVAIAGRLPRWIGSDHLSLLGLTSMLGAGLSFAAVQFTPWAALAVVAFLAANWFGDSLDGTVARVRGQQRPRYGYYIDHVIDLAGTTAPGGSRVLVGHAPSSRIWCPCRVPAGLGRDLPGDAFGRGIPDVVCGLRPDRAPVTAGRGCPEDR